MSKKYNNIRDVATTNLYKMLSLKNFQDEASQKMIKDEIKFRDEGVTMQQMINIFRGNNGQIRKLCKRTI